MNSTAISFAPVDVSTLVPSLEHIANSFKLHPLRTGKAIAYPAYNLAITTLSLLALLVDIERRSAVLAVELKADVVLYSNPVCLK